MGKIILEFDSVEEATEAQLALDGWKWKAAVWELDQALRATTKYGQAILDSKESASELEVDIAERLREKIRSILEEHNLTLND